MRLGQHIFGKKEYQSPGIVAIRLFYRLEDHLELTQVHHYDPVETRAHLITESGNMTHRFRQLIAKHQDDKS